MLTKFEEKLVTIEEAFSMIKDFAEEQGLRLQGTVAVEDEEINEIAVFNLSEDG
jgi:hypothetical protein